MDKSLQTKILLGNALKDLTRETPFSKIIVADISSRAGMSRKSFYYHFKDKYDLVNWIFDWEFGKVLGDGPLESWVLVERLFCYVDSERDYYQRLLYMNEQNCLAEHIVDYLYSRFTDGKPNVADIDFCATAGAESIVAVLKVWLQKYESITAPEACVLLKRLRTSGIKTI